MSTKLRPLTVLAIAAIATAGFGFAWQDSLNDPSRPEAERKRDAGSKPLQVYAFFGVEEGMTVIDLAPGAGYNTFLLSKIVGDSGRVIAGPDRRGSVQKRLDEAGEAMANVTVMSDMGSLEPASVDVIVTVRNVHDFENGGRAGGIYAAALAALRPGGVFGVVDARTPKEGFDDSTHRINEQMVIDHITAAGFELVESSDLLANPDDDFGKYEGMGSRVEVDRMVLKFRKPTS